MTSATAPERPPAQPARAMLLMKTPSSMVWSTILILSPRSAPPVSGLVGSIATIPTFSPFFL